MKYALIFFMMVFSLGGADGQPKLAGQTPGLRKEHVEKRDENGKVNCYVETVFRGNARVMMTVKFLTQNKYKAKMMRAYFANGKEVVDEEDYDDGTQEVRLYQGDVLCEMFRRRVDGSVEPVSGEELEKLKEFKSVRSPLIVSHGKQILTPRF